jgi:hypothetical protein
MTLEDRVQVQRLRVFRRAEEPGNVSAVRLVSWYTASGSSTAMPKMGSTSRPG